MIDVHKNTFAGNPKYSFDFLDAATNMKDIKPADMCIIKDVLQHWPTENIIALLDYVIENRIFKYILITNCCCQVEEARSYMKFGGWGPLLSTMYPLNKYNPEEILRYHSKQISLITTDK